ncbi:hypothetical protein B4109_0511 [Geobacillus stearothermophilus]|uniref:Uncharacterized protein n=1 Tax=Geobacillus stearothermophilus TaxID=1422 RepID=A0A150MRS8_GEOSE|nr:hypothetical protein B4109_0511 [Geobacillus stearothermophilus]
MDEEHIDSFHTKKTIDSFPRGKGRNASNRCFSSSILANIALTSWHMIRGLDSFFL